MHLKFFSDVFSSGLWRSQVQSSLLQQQLQKSLLSSRASSTVTTYLTAFQKFVHFASASGFCPLPASQLDVALYLQHMFNRSNSNSMLSHAFYGLSWVHSLCGFTNLSHSPVCRAVLESAARSKPGPVRRQAADLSVLSCLYRALYSPSANFSHQRTATLCLLMFAGCLRFSEVANLRACDVTVTSTALLITLHQSKTDQHKHGHQVVLAATGSTYCPVSNFLFYVRAACLDLSSTGLLFSNVSGSKLNVHIVSQSNTLRILRLILTSQGHPNPKSISLHSFRVGGATRLIEAGVDSYSVKEFGRWRGESSMDRYIRRSMRNKMCTSRAMNL